MSAELWHNFTPYQPDVQKALNELRQEVFRAGQFHRSELRPKTIDEAIRNADAVGTRSILDIERISPNKDIETISPVPPEQVRAIFGTTTPTRQLVEEALDKMEDSFQEFLETYDRCEGFYILTYNEAKPFEFFFAGWSAD